MITPIHYPLECYNLGLTASPWDSGREELLRELGEAGRPFVTELEEASSISRSDRRQKKLRNLWNDLLCGSKYAGFSSSQLRIADLMIRAALALPRSSQPGRRPGPITPAGQAYGAAVALVPDVVCDRIATDLRARAEELAVFPADNDDFCKKWDLAHLNRELRIMIIARGIRTDADRLAAEWCSENNGNGQGRAGWEHVAQKLMAKWPDLPDLPEYLKKAAHPDVLKANANSFAVQKSKANKRAGQIR